MTEREKIFGRIKEALRVEGPRAGAHHGHLPEVKRTYAEVLPPTGKNFEELVDLFGKNAADLRAEFKLLNNESELDGELAKLAPESKWTRIACQPSEFVRSHARATGLPLFEAKRGYDKMELAKCSASITECDALIAQTGTVLLTSRSGGGRALSCLPPHHVVLARREQLLPDLPSAFTLLQSVYGGSYPSMMSFITGPSRTGDIERILVLGAHGPKRLTILCL